jgi:amidase
VQQPDVVETVQACLDRLDRDVWGAVVHRRDQNALNEARDLQRRIDGRETVGPLAGACFTVKAALHTGELPATAGSLLLDDRPRRGAAVVQRLRRADAVLVGVTNCAEFALAPTDTNRRYGTTTNPVAPGRTPGGSSAGCAAAVAAGLVPFSVGTDYGGSMRYPAHCTATFGFRPARRSVPTGGQTPPPPPGSPRARFSVPGLLARDATILRAALPVFLGRTLVAQAPRRVGWTEGEGSVSVDDAIVAAVSEIAERLGGCPVETFGTNPLIGCEEVFAHIRATDQLEPIAHLAHRHGDQLTAPIRDALAQPIAAPDAATEAAAQELQGAAARFFRACPLLVAPIATRVAPPVHQGTTLAMLAPSRAVTLLGVAALAVPAGRSPDGIPIGVQLIGTVPAILWAVTKLEPPAEQRSPSGREGCRADW